MSQNINNNNFQNSEMFIPAQSQSTKVEKSAIERTLKNIVAPVFDFFTKEAPADTVVMKDYSDEISQYELKAAETQKILNDADPKTRSKLNIVI